MKPSIKQCIDFALWMRIHRLPRFFVERWQLWWLQRVVREAYEHVPAYRKLFDEQGIRPADIRILADIHKLPLTSKRFFRERPIEESMHDSFPSDGYMWKETSGSTGEPFRFPVCRYEAGSRGDIFHEFRFLLWRGFALKHIVKNMKIARISDSPHPCHVKTFSRALLRKDPELLIRQLKDFSPDIMEGRPTIFLELAGLAKIFSAPGELRFPFLIAYGEMLTSEIRGFIEDAFMGEVYSRYGLEETGDLAMECRVHEGFHLNEESCIVEILDDRDKPLPPGKEGRIIVTRFRYNSIMPFIRYDTGDRGVFIPGVCACGLRARRIGIYGRYGVCIKVGGKKFNLTEFEKIFEKLSSRILRYQIVRTSPKNLEVRIVPNRQFHAGDEKFVTGSFKEKFGLDLKVKLVHALHLNKSGKTPHFVDETGAPTNFG